MTRRQHGEGSHYQRGKRGGRGGQWVAVADLGWHDGKRDRREFTGATSEEARRKRDAFLARRRDGFTLPKGRQATVAQWCEHWLVNVAQQRVAPTTYYGSYESKVRQHIIPYFDRLPLCDLSEEDIEGFHRHLGKTLSAASVVQVHRIMSSALKAAVVRGRLPRNPCSNVTPPKVTRAPPEPPTAAEVARILEACKTWPNGARWVLALRTGLRQGEALALEWRDVRLAAPASVTVRQSAARVKGERVVKAPKSAKSRRTVPLPAVAVEALKAHRAAQGVADIGGLVFTTAKGQPVNPRADYDDWQALLAELGVRRYRVHDCRHAVATALLEAGTDPRVVQDIMGWSSLAMTEIYQHVRPALAQRALDALDG